MIDVTHLGDFYSTGLGRLARRLIKDQLSGLYPPLSGQTVLGLGYAQPWLGPLRKDADGVFAFCPARLGVTHWPRGEKNLTALVDETGLPLEDSSIDFALVVHCLEFTNDVDGLLQELWRVLSGQAKVIFIVPNRRGLWARFDTTPFGHGHPYSRMQMTRLLRSARFIPSGWSRALYTPPVTRRFILRSAPAIERIGRWASPGFGGVTIIEATKQLYSVSPAQARRVAIKPLKPQGATVAPIKTRH